MLDVRFGFRGRGVVTEYVLAVVIVSLDPAQEGGLVGWPTILVGGVEP